MDVWVVELGACHEGTELQGVFSTEEGALAAAQSLLRDRNNKSYDFVQVLRVGLDSLVTYRSPATQVFFGSFNFPEENSKPFSEEIKEWQATVRQAISQMNQDLLRKEPK